MATPLSPRGWPIRRHPRIAHLSPYRFSDSLASVRRAKVLGYRRTDKNGQADQEHVTWIVHWSTIGKNRGLTHIVEADGKGRRRLTHHELDSQIKDHPTEWVARLRYGRFGRALVTARRMMVQHQKLGLDMFLEGKGTVRGRPAFELLAADAIATRVRIGFMRLQDIPDWREAFEDALAVGFACAMLVRGPKPSDWSGWAARGVQSWGRWRG